MKRVVDLKTLPGGYGGFYLFIDNGFRRKIFTYLKKKFCTWTEVKKKLGVLSWDVFIFMRRGLKVKNKKSTTFPISVSNIKRVSKLSRVPYMQIEKHVKGIRKQTGLALPIGLPILGTPELAELVGHAMGDGHIHKKTKAFSFVNQDLDLIDRVRTLVKSVFKCKVYYLFDKGNRTTSIIFPYIIGEFLILAGVPQGKKTEKAFSVPSWIMKGDRKTQAAFLAALFSNEGSVHNVRLKREYRQIVFTYGKSIRLKRSLVLFINQIKRLLKRFGIDSGKINFQNYTTVDGTQKTFASFRISNHNSIKNFQIRVGMISKNKGKQLLEILKTFKNSSNHSY